MLGLGLLNMLYLFNAIHGLHLHSIFFINIHSIILNYLARISP